MVATWINHDVAELRKSWGEPLIITEQPGGASKYVYSYASSMTHPGFLQPIPVTDYHSGTITASGTHGYATAHVNGFTQSTAFVPTGPLTFSSSCTTEFEVNAAGKISFVSFVGNACKR